ncbi:hypothetical protein VTK26DRAFT_7694 [Humicola hyalothermophila]
MDATACSETGPGQAGRTCSVLHIQAQLQGCHGSESRGIGFRLKSNSEYTSTGGGVAGPKWAVDRFRGCGSCGSAWKSEETLEVALARLVVLWLGMVAFRQGGHQNGNFGEVSAAPRTTLSPIQQAQMPGYNLLGEAARVAHSRQEQITAQSVHLDRTLVIQLYVQQS